MYKGSKARLAVLRKHGNMAIESLERGIGN